MIEGKENVLDACRMRGMRVTEKQLNLLESLLTAAGTLDGMDMQLDICCVRGMPGESAGALVIKGNLGQLLAAIERLWPTADRRRNSD